MRSAFAVGVVDRAHRVTEAVYAATLNGKQLLHVEAAAGSLSAFGLLLAAGQSGYGE
jgi:hypothetical protein